jgi:hypothetical protein
MKARRKYGEITGRLTAPVLRDLYLGREKSLQEIADAYGCTRQMIDLLMAKYGIARRERISAVKLAGRKGKFRGLNGGKADALQTADKRAELRLNYPHIVEYTVDPGATDEHFKAMCADISNSGICLYVCKGLDAGQKICFKSGVPVVSGEARVKWCSRISGNVYKAGLSFSETADMADRIKDLVHSNFLPDTL